MQFSDSEIVAQCQTGNWINFDQLYAKYLPKIYQYSYYRIRHKQVAEDITAAVFLKTVQNLGSFKLDGLFAAWIYSIARNTLIDHTRTAKPTSDLDEAANVVSGHDVPDATDAVMRLDSVKASLAKLSEIQREVLILRVWDGLSHREIGEILNISENNSKVTFSRAVNALRQIVPVSVLLMIIGGLNS